MNRLAIMLVMLTIIAVILLGHHDLGSSRQYESRVNCTLNQAGQWVNADTGGPCQVQWPP